MKKLALVGSANAGKTTLFNLLTHSHYNTVNYPGATVAYTVGHLQTASQKIEVMDTPGITSLIPHSSDEMVTVSALFDEKTAPDLILAVADATQLSRHLYLVKQLIDAGFDLILVVTMVDLLEKKAKSLDLERIQQELKIPVYAVDARHQKSLNDFIPQLEKSLESSHGLARVEANFVENIDEIYVQEQYAWADLIEHKAIKQSQIVAFGSRVDQFLMHPVGGLICFFAIMFAIFSSIFWFAQPLMEGIDFLISGLMDLIRSHTSSSWGRDLFVDGVVGGLGMVLVFLPQIMILFMCMGWMEDSGYLARGAALIDKPLSKLGLNGKSFVPLLSGYACAIPAMIAARTIPNRFERNLTIMMIPLLSCSARLPVYGLLISFLAPAPWVGGLILTTLYVMGFVIGAILSSILARFLPSSEPSSFVLEVPTLRKPQFKIIVISTYHKVKEYLKEAGPTIILISVVLWALLHLPLQNGQTPEIDQSWAAMLGHWLNPIMEPLGLDWRAGVAMIAGFAAREVFVSALALVYHIQVGNEDQIQETLVGAMRTLKHSDGSLIFTYSSVAGLIVFFMIALQCFPTVAVAKKEFGHWKFAFYQLLGFTFLAYGMALATVKVVGFWN